MGEGSTSTARSGSPSDRPPDASTHSSSGQFVFWLVTTVLFICNGLLAWEVRFIRLPSHERPSITHEKWFLIATLIGTLGWIAIPIMFYMQYGFIGAALAAGAYLIFGALFAIGIAGFIERQIEADSSTALADRSLLDEVQETGERLIVDGYRRIARERGIAPRVATTDDEIVDIYKKVGSAFSSAARERGEHIPALQLNHVVLYFLQAYEQMSPAMFEEHLNYEVSKYLSGGLRADYQKELKLW